MALMRANNVTLAGRVQAIDLELVPGQVVGLIGPNGSGKSSLLGALSGTLAASGHIEVEGKGLEQMDAAERAQKIALQPQFVNSAWSLCVADIVSLGRIPWGDMDQAIIAEAMCQAGVESLADKRVDELSGGERARVWLARVLATRASILLMDEPVATLDIHYQHSVLKVLRAYAAQGHAVLMAIHDLSLAARYCDRLCLLQRGRLVCTGSVAEVMTEQRLRDAFAADIHVDLLAKPPVVLAR